MTRPVVLRQRIWEPGTLTLALSHVVEIDEFATRRRRHVLAQTLTRRVAPTAPRHGEVLGDSVFTPAGLDGLQPNHPGEYRVVTCWFTDREIGDCEAEPRNLYALKDVADGEVRNALLGVAREMVEPSFSGAARAEALALQAVERVCGKLAGRSPTDGRAQNARAERYLAIVRDYAETVTGERPSAAAAAAACGVSGAHLMRLFTRTTGQPLHDYIEGVRLRRAMTELAEGRCQIKEISWRLGFAAPSGFSIAFRRLTGQTPQQFRQQHRRWSAC